MDLCGFFLFWKSIKHVKITWPCELLSFLRELSIAAKISIPTSIIKGDVVNEINKLCKLFQYLKRSKLNNKYDKEIIKGDALMQLTTNSMVLMEEMKAA